MRNYLLILFTILCFSSNAQRFRTWYKAPSFTPIDTASLTPTLGRFTLGLDTAIYLGDGSKWITVGANTNSAQNTLVHTEQINLSAQTDYLINNPFPSGYEVKYVQIVTPEGSANLYDNSSVYWNIDTITSQVLVFSDNAVSDVRVTLFGYSETLSDYSPTVETATLKLPLIIGLGQSNGTVRGPFIDSADVEIYSEVMRKIAVTPSEISYTNSNSGGVWKSPTGTMRLVWEHYKFVENKRSFIVGIDAFKKMNADKPSLFIDASVSGQSVEYFHPGGGADVSATGAGWTSLINKLDEAYTWASYYNIKLVPELIMTFQGEGDAGTYGASDAGADQWINAWQEIHDSITSYLNVSRFNHNFVQIFHTSPSFQPNRLRLNQEMENLATINSEYNYVELLTADDIANQDPNNYTQDMEHWGYGGLFNAALQAALWASKNKSNETILIE